MMCAWCDGEALPESACEYRGWPIACTTHAAEAGALRDASYAMNRRMVERNGDVADDWHAEIIRLHTSKVWRDVSEMCDSPIVGAGPNGWVLW